MPWVLGGGALAAAVIVAMLLGSESDSTRRDVMTGAPPSTAAPSASDVVRGSQEGLKQHAVEQDELEQIRAELRKLIDDVPDFAALASNVVVDNTLSGVRIHIMDQSDVDIFAPGSANLYPRSRELVARIAMVIEKRRNLLRISGHIDPSPAVDPSGYTN